MCFVMTTYLNEIFEEMKTDNTHLNQTVFINTMPKFIKVIIKKKFCSCIIKLYLFIYLWGGNFYLR